MVIFLVLVASFCSSVLALSARQLAQTNCTAGTTPCGSGTVCCASGLHCNFNRGIPACENFADPLISGFLGPPCADPYLFDCSAIVGIPGFCCPTGTICFNNGLDKVVSCIDAVGTTAAALPSATQGFVPSATSVANTDANISFDPPSAWTSSSTSPSCSSGKTLRVTDVVNSTITFNYTGPSIMIRTVTSPQGGQFSVFVDGFNTTDVIDTFASANSSFPLCYPIQYPPFLKLPPNFAMQNDHSITLTYLGPSSQAQNDPTTASVQFDSFAVPEFQTLAAASGAESIIGGSINNALIPLAVAVFLASDLYFY